MIKYSRVYAKIDLDRIRKNIRNIRNRIGHSSLMAVIKADGYGHGAVVTAKHIEDLVDFYAVATIDEALDLQTSFIGKPILILGGCFEESFPDLIRHEIRATVFTYETAKMLSDYAVLMDLPCYIHIKVDTGMSRIGFACDDRLTEKIRKICTLPNLVVEGIFTHFANADEEDKTKVNRSYEVFSEVVDRLSENGIHIPFVHCANSAAIIDLPETHRDMVRAGIVLYGYYPSDEVKPENLDVRPALELKSHVVYVKEIDAGIGVSYNSTYVTEKKTRVATIPVGYADGYPRALSNCGEVLIRGRRAPILGRVCMDQFIVDVTHIDDVRIHDEVVLIGRSGSEEITLEELAGQSGKFNYEFICGLSKRIPRLYYKGGKLVDEVNFFYTARRV